MAGQVPVWMEGFEVFKTVAALSRRYISTSHNLTFGAGRLFPASRTGVYATTSFSSLKIPVLGNHRHWLIGGAFFVGLPVAGTKIIHTLKNNVDQLRLQVYDDGTLAGFRMELRYGSGTGTLLWTSPVSFPYGYDIYIELLVDHQSTSTGSVKLWVNEFLFANLTNVITAPDGTAENYAVDLHIQSGGLMRFDDSYALADTTTAPTPLGDQQIEAITANADFSTQWSRSTGTDSYALVDDPSEADDDSTYVFVNADNQEDLYDLSNLVNIGGDITCVAVHTDVRLVSSGQRNIQHRARSGSTTGTGAVKVVNSTSYRIVSTYFATNPVTSAAWTPSEVDGAKIGMATSP